MGRVCVYACISSGMEGKEMNGKVFNSWVSCVVSKVGIPIIQVGLIVDWKEGKTDSARVCE